MNVKEKIHFARFINKKLNCMNVFIFKSMI